MSVATATADGACTVMRESLNAIGFPQSSGAPTLRNHNKTNKT